MTNATYFNGQLSTGFPAQWTAYPNYWLINYYDSNNYPQTVRWELGDIVAGDASPQTSTFRYGEFPQQTLLLDTQQVKPYLPAHIQNHTVDGWILNEGTKGVLMATACLIGLVISVYWWIIPPLAERFASHFPIKYEKELGNKLFEKITADYNINHDATTTINEFADQIDFNTDYDINITVVQDSQVNAFAIPGGNIVVFDGILQKMDRPEQLAALIGHEAGHVKHRHSLKSLFRSLSRYFFVSILTTDINGISTAVLENANMLLNLQYSRQLEQQADQTAIQTLNDNQIDQEGATQLFSILQKESEEQIGSNFSIPAFLSTHPLTEDRIALAKQAAQQQTNEKEQPDLNRIFQQLKKDLDNIQ